MPLRNQNRAPLPSPNIKKEALSGIPLDNRRKAQGTGRRQVLSTVNRQDVTANSDVGSIDECSGKVEFTKDEVLALLNERAKAGKFDTKAKIEQMTDIIKKLKVCVRWFQVVDETHVQEKDNFRSSLEVAEKRYNDKALEAKTKEEELQAIIAEMKDNIASVEEKFSKEELNKLDAIENHRREKKCRVAAEKLQDSLREELDKVKEEKMAAKNTVTSLDDRYRRVLEYNISLQQHNTKLQTDLEVVKEAKSRAEKEKSTILENLTTLRGHGKSLQDQLASSRVTQEEAVKQKESLMREVDILRSELQQVRVDRDLQVTSLDDRYRRVFEYNISLQQHNTKLQTDLEVVKEEKSRAEKEKSSILENLTTLRGQRKSLQDQLASSRVTQDEAVKQKESLMREVDNLRSELQQVRIDRDLQVEHSQKLG